MSDFVGRPLTELLRSRMRQDGLSFAQLAKRLRVGQSYLSQLLSGAKPLSSVSDSFLRACSEYLAVPVVYVFLLSGRLQYRDFFAAPATMEMHILTALGVISRSSIAMEAALGEETLLGLPKAAQVLVILLYEKAEQVVLLPKRVGKSEIEHLGQLHVPFEVRIHKPE